MWNLKHSKQCCYANHGTNHTFSLRNTFSIDYSVQQKRAAVLHLPTWKCLAFEIANHSKRKSSTSFGQLKILYVQFNCTEGHVYTFLPTFVKWRLPMSCIYPVFMTSQHSLQIDGKYYFNTYNKSDE